MIKVEKLNPFGRMCISLGMLPSSYKESLTYEEQLLWFFKYLDETVIPTVNNNAEAVEELQALYIEVKTFVDEYFDNLDVQEEINTKLDEMAESGELTDIIAQYLGLAGMLTYNTVADMKLAENLANGSSCQTMGFHSVNDMGGAVYKVREIINTDVIDNMKLIALYDNSLVAELLITPEMNVKQFGAKGDGTTDDTSSIQTCINTVNNIIIPQGNYMINVNGGDYDQGEISGIIIGSNKNIKLDNNAYVKAITNNSDYYKLFNIKNANNVHISGGHIYGDKLTHTGSTLSEWGYCIGITDSSNVLIENCDVAYGFGDSIALSGSNHGISTYCSNITIKNCLLHDSRRQGISIIAAQHVTVENCEIYNISGIAPQAGIDVESNYPDDNPVKYVYINNCYIHDTAGNSITVTSKSENVIIENSNLYSCFNVNGKNVKVNKCFMYNAVSGSSDGFYLNDCVITFGSTYQSGKLYISNSTTYDRFTTESNNNLQEIHFNNCELNFIDSTYSQMFVVRPNHKLFINDCVLNFNKSLGTTYAEHITVENSTLNPGANALDGFFTKNLVFKNNIVNNYALYRVAALNDGSYPSYVTNNVFKVNPSTVFGGSSSQYLFITNNISPSALSAGSLTNVIVKDNYNNSTT